VTRGSENDVRAAESNLQKPRCQATNANGLRCEFREDHRGHHLNGIDVLGFPVQWSDAEKRPGDAYDRLGEAFAKAFKRGGLDTNLRGDIDAMLRLLDGAVLVSGDFTMSEGRIVGDLDDLSPLKNQQRRSRRWQDITITIRGIR
jgi:hypothetical protein